MKYGEMTTNAQGGREGYIGVSYKLMDPYALRALAELIYEGAVSHDDPTGENWKKISVDDHLDHAIDHIVMYRQGDRKENHLLHAKCRLHFAVAMQMKAEREAPSETFRPASYDPSRHPLTPAYDGLTERDEK